MRVTVNLDDEAGGALEELADELDAGKSQVVRNALEFYARYVFEWDEPAEDVITWSLRYLGGRGHMIFDLDHAELIFDTLDMDEAFMDEVRLSGRQHGRQWREEFSTVEDKLRPLEIGNFFDTTRIGEGEWVLNLTVPETAEFVTAFLESECEELGLDVEIENLGRRIVVRER